MARVLNDGTLIDQTIFSEQTLTDGMNTKSSIVKTPAIRSNKLHVLGIVNTAMKCKALTFTIIPCKGTVEQTALIEKILIADQTALASGTVFCEFNVPWRMIRDETVTGIKIGITTDATAGSNSGKIDMYLIMQT